MTAKSSEMLKYEHFIESIARLVGVNKKRIHTIMLPALLDAKKTIPDTRAETTSRQSRRRRKRA